MKKLVPVLAVIALVASSCGGGAGPVDRGQVKQDASQAVNSGITEIKNLAGGGTLNPNDPNFQNAFQQNGVRGWMDFSNIPAIGMVGMGYSPALSPGKSINALRSALKLKPLQELGGVDLDTLENYCPDAVKVEQGVCDQSSGCCSYVVKGNGSCDLPDGSHVEGSVYFEVHGCSDGTFNMNMSADLSGVDPDGTSWTFQGSAYFDGVYDEQTDTGNFEAGWIGEYNDDNSHQEEAAWVKVYPVVGDSVTIDLEYGSLDCPSDWGGSIKNCEYAEYASIQGLTWDPDPSCRPDGGTANGTIESAWWDGANGGYVLIDMQDLVIDPCNCSYSSLLNDYEPADGTLSLSNGNETLTLDFTDGICNDNCVNWSYENQQNGTTLSGTVCGTW